MYICRWGLGGAWVGASGALPLPLERAAAPRLCNQRQPSASSPAAARACLRRVDVAVAQAQRRQHRLVALAARRGAVHTQPYRGQQVACGWCSSRGRGHVSDRGCELDERWHVICIAVLPAAVLTQVSCQLQHPAARGPALGAPPARRPPARTRAQAHGLHGWARRVVVRILDFEGPAAAWGCRWRGWLGCGAEGACPAARRQAQRRSACGGSPARLSPALTLLRAAEPGGLHAVHHALQQRRLLLLLLRLLRVAAVGGRDGRAARLRHSRRRRQRRRRRGGGGSAAGAALYAVGSILCPSGADDRPACRARASAPNPCAGYGCWRVLTVC